MSIDLYKSRSALEFNDRIKGWLEGDVHLKSHKTPKTFDQLLNPYQKYLDDLEKNGSANPCKEINNHLTDLMFGVDISKSLTVRLSQDTLSGGFRSQVSQGIAKNAGENFVNLMVYNLACNLADTGLCVDKGLHPTLNEEMRLTKSMLSTNLTIPIEGDLCIFDFNDPLNAIVISAKTRLKEIFHVGTMWALFFQIARDEQLMTKLGIEGRARRLDNVSYCFATADMIPPGGRKSQGPDIERESVRNLIKMDASFFDWVFVSKSGIPHTGKSIGSDMTRDAFFHELSCLYDLIDAKFGKQVFR